MCEDCRADTDVEGERCSKIHAGLNSLCRGTHCEDAATSAGGNIANRISPKTRGLEKLHGSLDETQNILECSSCVRRPCRAGIDRKQERHSNEHGWLESVWRGIDRDNANTNALRG